MKLQETSLRRKINLGDPGNTLILLFAICMIFFLGLGFLKAVWYFKYPKEIALENFYSQVLSWFSLPATLGKLGSRPWTLITHGFVHIGFWPVLTNMLWLWCFGSIFQNISGNNKIIPIFVYGTIAGGTAFILSFQFIPALASSINSTFLLGASAGIMAIAIAVTVVSPGFRIFPQLRGGIPLWGLTAFYIVADLATAARDSMPILLSHIAGGLTGFLFIFLLKQGFDIGAWMNNFFDWVGNLFNPDRPAKNKINIKDELFYKSGKTTPYTKTPHVTQQRIDDILDKINQQGYDFLTKEEKDMLKRASKEGLK